ncbi:MAG: RNA polymerase sigma-54 factor [Blastocatellia bacterium]
MSTLRLTTSMQQKMVLTPQLRQRIEMLQMTALELQDLIEQELVANPVLEEVLPGEEVSEISANILDQNAEGQYDELREPAPASDDETHSVESPSLNGNAGDFDPDQDIAAETQTENSDAFEEVDFGREFQEYLDPGYKTQEIEYKEDTPNFDQFLSRKESLAEHLEWQLNLSEASGVTKLAAIAIIGNLDGDGRLTSSIDDIANLAGVTTDTVEQARRVIMSLDPVGCGALTVNECLLAQLEAQGLGDSLSAMLVRDHLEDLQPHRLHHLARNTGLDIYQLNAELQRIRSLDPYPGRRYSSEEAIFVAPEVYIEKVEDDYVIYFADDGSPRLRINQTYNRMLDQSDTPKETRDFIKDKMRSALDLLRNIEHRRQTIYRVVECIVRRQRDFLDKGVEYIKPMMLKDVAEDIGMHLSTISRVVNRKYAHTPQGVIELRRFFTEGMMNEDGEEVSTRILKLKVKKMIEEEDTRKPLTDDQIAKLLSNEGVKLSRRTVAKYRDQMNIPGSRERKTVV